MLNPELQPGRQPTLPAPLPGPNIVLVDDDPDFRDLLGAMIHDALPGARIQNFGNGIPAWKYLEQESPDLLISDLRHCGMDGFEMLSHLARQGAVYPILIVSGCLPGELRQACLCAGPRLNVHYRPKPFDVSEFICLVKQCLNQLKPQDLLLRWSASLPRPLKIVQLDDEDFVFQIVNCFLQRCLRNVRLYQFQHGADAWRILTEAQPDLLITSDRMWWDPEWTGENIVRRLVAQRVDYPILVASGWPPTHDWVCRVQARYPKCFYLLKPFSADQFYRQLTSAFGPIDVS